MGMPKQYTIGFPKMQFFSSIYGEILIKKSRHIAGTSYDRSRTSMGVRAGLWKSSWKRMHFTRKA